MLKRLCTSVSRSVLIATGLCLATVMPLSAQAGTISVDLNKTQVLQLPSPAGAVVVGNPAIADISVHSPTLFFVVGRGYGTTNVIILDELGNVISNNDIQVGFNKTAASKRVLFAGKGWQSYECNPFCQPAPILGDDTKFILDHAGKEKLIDSTNSPIMNTPSLGQSSVAGSNTTTPGSFPNFSGSGFPSDGFNPSQMQGMPIPSGQRSSDGDY